MAKLLTGSIYKVKHKDKGIFLIAVRFADKNFTTGTVIEGKVIAFSNNAQTFIMPHMIKEIRKDIMIKLLKRFAKKIERLNEVPKKDYDGFTAYQHKITELWHGVLEYNHPTPSGCDRWFVKYSTTQGFEYLEDAMGEIKKLIKQKGFYNE